MAKGGKQPGAGRPKGTIMKHTADAIEMRKKIVETVNKNLTPLLEAKMDLALGHYEEREDKDGAIRVYQKAPDGPAIQYLLNQSVGKPKETMEVMGDMTLKIDC